MPLSSRRVFTLSPAPLESPLQLSNGVITNPEWRGWFQKTLFPALAAQGNFSLADVLQFQRPTGEDGRSAAAEAVNLSAMTRGNAPSADLGSLMLTGPGCAPAAEPVTLALWAAMGGESSGLPWVLVDTHANRTNYPNAAYELGALFVESDRRVFYRNSGADWLYVAGTYVDLLANRPAGFGANDAGFEFYATDKELLYYWDGAAWQVLGPPPLASGEIWVGNASGVAQNRVMSGDATLSNTGALTLANTAVVAGVYGDSKHVADFIVDAKGRLTFADNVAISFSDIADGTYTVGIGPTTNGTLTFVGGRITAIVEAS